MRIATHNVNSIRTRVDRVINWLERTNTDVLAMQEIKCKPDQFPYKQFEDAGYHITMHGLNQWNGVAFAYRADLEPQDIELSFTDQPQFKDVVEARAIGATFNGVRIWSLYVPHGRGLEDPHMEYKLEFLDRLASLSAEQLEMDPNVELCLMGDFNIAPLDSDVYDVKIGRAHV